jgi:hypothetical protein
VLDVIPVVDAALLAAVIAVITPLLIAIVNQPRLTSGWRLFIALSVSTVVGVLTAAANGDLGANQSTVTSIFVVIAATQASYKYLWADTVVPYIEWLTSPWDRHLFIVDDALDAIFGPTSFLGTLLDETIARIERDAVKDDTPDPANPPAV